MSGDYALLMKTAAGAGGIELVRRTRREPGTGEALVRIRQAAICGTDLHIIGWNAWAAKSYQLPLTLGHEFSGDVVALGSDVAGFAIGDRVTAETHLACGACAQCRIGRGHTCLNLRVFSRLNEGAFSEYAVVPVALLRKVPAGLDHRHACLMEPLGIALRAVQASAVGTGSLLVSGCGPIGLLAVASAHALGVQKIVATDLSESRRRMAQALGAQWVCDPRTQDPRDSMGPHWPEGGVDAAVEASGADAALQSALALVRPGGTVVLAGMPSAPVALDLARHVILREVVLKGVYGRELQDTWAALAALLPRLHGALDILITHEFSLAEFEQAFATAMSGDAGKVQFRLA